MSTNNNQSNDISECPVVGHNNPAKQQQSSATIPNNDNNNNTSITTNQSTCPATPFLDSINPNNNMPTNLAQQPWPGQILPLDTNRVLSSIPKAEPSNNSSSTPPPPLPQHQTGVEQSKVWVYPSEQQFFNAMKRKGWSNADERDMNVIVQIHNAVNEKSWAEVKKWEALHACDCEIGPRLLKFSGKPTEMSPKARFLTMLGYTPPFDRHDWIIDRCGKQVRYVVDFYQGKQQFSNQPQSSTTPPPPPPVSMYIDARPALDSFEAVWDRMKMWIWSWKN
jgi:cytochrome c heme-lyase